MIIEYKRSVNENVINQGLFYLDWLLDHKGDYYHLVLKQLGNKVAEEIEDIDALETEKSEMIENVLPKLCK